MEPVVPVTRTEGKGARREAVDVLVCTFHTGRMTKYRNNTVLRWYRYFDVGKMPEKNVSCGPLRFNVRMYVLLHAIRGGIPKEGGQILKYRIPVFRYRCRTDTEPVFLRVSVSVGIGYRYRISVIFGSIRCRYPSLLTVRMNGRTTARPSMQ